MLSSADVAGLGEGRERGQPLFDLIRFAESAGVVSKQESGQRGRRGMQGGRQGSGEGSERKEQLENSVE